MLFFNSIVLIDKGSGDGRQPRRNRKRDLLKRVMSSSHQRSNTIDVSDSERFDSPVRDVKSIVSEFLRWNTMPVFASYKSSYGNHMLYLLASFYFT